MSEMKAGAHEPMTKQAFLIRSELKVKEGKDFLLWKVDKDACFDCNHGIILLL